MCCWSPEEIELIERDIPNPDTEDFQNRTRSDIHDYIRNKMVRKDDVTEESWGNLYRSWFKNNTAYMSAFAITIDNRLFALVRAGFIQKAEQQGIYQLARALSKDEWDTVTGVDKLPPQKDLVIKRFSYFYSVGP